MVDMIKNINKSAYNFFLCIEFILHNRIFTLDDIISFLENFYSVFVFREAVLKYIRTLKLVGFEFERLDNKTYNLKNIPLKIDANLNDEEVFFKCLQYMKKYYISKSRICGADNLFEKIHLFFPDKLQKVSNKHKKMLNDLKPQNDMLKAIKKYCEDGLRLEVTYLDDEEKVQNLIEPLDIFINKTVFYLRGFNLNKKTNMLIDFDKIIDVVQTPLKNKFLFNTSIILR